MKVQRTRVSILHNYKHSKELYLWHALKKKAEVCLKPDSSRHLDAETSEWSHLNEAVTR